MDVTSMLNTSSETAEQPKPMEMTKTPTRNRTPWDAGGYSLPIHTHNGPFTSQIQYNESPMEGHPDLSCHKLSDSHSSLSSFASSNSTSHSRFSSTSTVSSLHPPRHIAADGTFTDTDADSHSSKAGTGSQSPISPFTAVRIKPAAILSPTGS